MLKQDLSGKLIFGFCFFILTATLSGQTNTTSKDSSAYLSINQLLSVMEKKHTIQFFYNPQWFSDKKFPVALSELPLDECLLRLKRLTGYSVVVMGSKSYVFVPTETISYKETDRDKTSYFIVGNMSEYGKYSKATFTGKIVDGKSGDPLVGAILLINKPKMTITTDKDGSFSVNLPVGEYDINIRYMGYEDDVKRVKLVSDGSLTLDLFEKSVHIDEIVIAAEKAEVNVSRPQMSFVKLNSKAIKELPSSLGEKDIIKSFTLMPGIQSVGEFGTGFNVRGGTADQNLILVQDVPLFNSSHVFGLTSSINPDNVLDATLLKGGIPAQYGERVSSVMDIEMGSSNTKDFKVKGGIGLLDSRLSVETPLANKKVFLQIGGRTSYSDWLLHNTSNQTDLMNSSARFYDVNGLLSLNINSFNKLTFFGYSSHDQFNYNGQIDYSYGNRLASAKWNHVFSKNVSGSFMAGLSSYSYHKDFVDPSEAAYDYKVTTTTNYYKTKGNINWIASDKHNLNLGIDAICYDLNPGTETPYGTQSQVSASQVPKEKALELATYISDLFTINNQLAVEAGVRFTEYLFLGPANINVYSPNSYRDTLTITNILHYGNNRIVQKLPRLEPRLSVRYSLDAENSVKLSYNRINQFIHLISNTAVMSPEDVWKLSDPNTKPLQCDQFALGYFRNFSHNAYETSIEVYYKKLNHIVDYKEGATILMNPILETELLNAKGYNTGAELYLKKNSGKLTGWLSYTYSLSKQKTTSNFSQEQVNNNRYYSSSYERPNNLVINANYHATRRWRFSALFTYSTGRPETYPEYIISSAGYQYVAWSDRNKYRLPDYHRLDISVTLDESLRLKKKWKGNWTLSIINVYGHKNVFSTFYQKTTPSILNGYRQYAYYQMYIVGQPLPTLTYNFIF